MLTSDLPSSRDAEIVVELFDRLLVHLRKTVACIDERDVEGRFKATGAALDILCLLYEGLDPEGRDSWTEGTRALYLHVIRGLAQINVRDDRRAAESMAMLVTPLRQAWATLCAQASLIESASTFATISAAATLNAQAGAHA
ncbi:MAG: hypothetical protein FJX35_26790 [Alphaproteobacteria bacterium]|nr:hypothetical protein [Alphaproteobacteria bacterium]